MIRIENDCVGCPQGCISCGRKHIPHYYCDECEEEISENDMYDDDGEMLCRECLLDRHAAKPESFSE